MGKRKGKKIPICPDCQKPLWVKVDIQGEYEVQIPLPEITFPIIGLDVWLEDIPMLPTLFVRRGITLNEQRLAKGRVFPGCIAIGGDYYEMSIRGAMSVEAAEAGVLSCDCRKVERNSCFS